MTWMTPLDWKTSAVVIMRRAALFVGDLDLAHVHR